MEKKMKHKLDKDEWNFYDNKEPSELQVCWVRLFECYGDTILEESYHLVLFVCIHREEWERKHISSKNGIEEKLVKDNEMKYYHFIDHDGYIIGDGSGTEVYQWKHCISEFQQWGDAVKWKAIKKFNDMKSEWEKRKDNCVYHVVKERCVSQVNLKANQKLIKK
jgi:hypothetical protein